MEAQPLHKKKKNQAATPEQLTISHVKLRWETSLFEPARPRTTTFPEENRRLVIIRHNDLTSLGYSIRVSAVGSNGSHGAKSAEDDLKPRKPTLDCEVLLQDVRSDKRRGNVARQKIQKSTKMEKFK